MKKIIAGITLATTLGTANAMPTIHQLNPVQPTYNHTYSAAYHHGKNQAYQNVAHTLFAVGAIAIVGVVVYNLGQESRWGVSENGLSYKF